MKKFRKRFNKKRRNIWLIFILLLLFIGTGYASLRDSFSISGTTSIDGNTWSVYFANVSATANNNYTPFASPTFTDTTSLSFNINFSEPNEIYEFTVQVINNGSLDAKIGDIQYTLPDDINTWNNYIEFSVTYSDGSAINIGDELPRNTTQTLKVRARYKVTTYEGLLHNNSNLHYGFSIKYVQDA